MKFLEEVRLGISRLDFCGDRDPDSRIFFTSFDQDTALLSYTKYSVLG